MTVVSAFHEVFARHRAAKVAHIVQQRGRDEGVGCARSLGQRASLQHVLCLGYRFAEIALRALALEQHRELLNWPHGVPVRTASVLIRPSISA